MPLHNDLMSFIITEPAFYQPILSAFTPEKLISDPIVLGRLCYGKAPQNVHGLPYLVFEGPVNWDQGSVSGGAVGQKIGNFWFSVYCPDMDDAMDWITAIEERLLALFVPGYYFTAATGRITSMLYVANSKLCMAGDQTQRTSEEFPYSGATIQYQIGWQ